VRNLLPALALLLAAPGWGAAGETVRPAARVVAIESRATPFQDSLVIRGRTEADRRVEVRAQIEGLVASAPIRKGTLVREGDVLCRLDPGGRPANLAEAEANLKQAQAEFDAAEKLVLRGFTSETETLTRGARLEAARAQVMRAQMEMDRLVILAPFDGVLETDTAELGALLQAGSTCATLIALDPIVLVGFVAERDVDRLTIGAPASARLVTGRRIEGICHFISRAADEETRTYRVEVVAPNPELAVRDGMTAEITIPLPPAAAHFVPQSAMTLNNDGVLGVRLAVDGKARFAPVGILSDAPDGVWLTGLPDVADIIIVGQEYVSDGYPVEIRRPGTAALR
jgi:multidrug efflux system membrane fusion protein